MVLRFAVVGCGKIATRGHLPALKALEREGLVELVTVADLNERAARRTVKAFGVPNYHVRPEDVAKRADVDAVCICTPTPTHAELCLLFAGAGKHILVEKPLCRTMEEARAVEEAAKSSGILLSVVQNYRYIRAVREAKRAVLEGRLGRLLSIRGVLHRPFPVRWTRSRWLYEEGGVIYDHGPHLADTVLWLKGVRSPERIKSIHAAGGDLVGQAGFVSHAHALVEFDDGSSASLSISWLAGMEEFTLSLHGTGGSASIDVLYDAYVEEHGFRSPFDMFRLYYEGLKSTLRDYLRMTNPYDRPMAVYPELISDFVRAAEGRGKPPVELGEALATTLILDEMRKQLTSRAGGSES